MKKILAVLAITILFASMSLATSAPVSKDINVLSAGGSFSGFIGVPKQQDPIIMGTISGEFQKGNRVGRFTGVWSIDYQNKSGTGTIQGVFGKHIFLARLHIDQVNKTLPVIGFLGANAQNLTFKGRGMSFVGPALYFWGTYTPN